MEWATTSTILSKLSDQEQRTVWDQLVAHFRQPIVRYATHLGLSAADAEDVAQETLLAFAQAYRGGRYDRAKGRLKDWLFGIAHRQALNARRKTLGRAERAVGQAEDAPTPVDLIPDPEATSAVWEREWRTTVYERALERVRAEVADRTFEVFRLLALEERPVPEVEAALGVTRTQVYNARYRVTKRLRELVTEYEEA